MRARKDKLDFIGDVKIRDTWLTGSIDALERHKGAYREKYFKKDLSVVYLDYLEHFSFCPIFARIKHRRYSYTTSDILQFVLNECILWVLKYNSDISFDVLIGIVSKFCEALKLSAEESELIINKSKIIRRTIYEKRTFGNVKVNYPAAIQIGNTQIRHMIPAIYRYEMCKARPEWNRDLVMLIYTPELWRDIPKSRSVLYQFLQIWALEEMGVENARIRTIHVSDDLEVKGDNLNLPKDCSDSRANLANIISKIKAPNSLPHITICKLCEARDLCSV